MKITIALMALLGLAVLFAGCPYESIVPIDGSTTTDPQLLGRWTDEKEHVTYEVSRKDKSTYAIRKIEREVTDAHFVAQPSIVNGVTFLNLQQIKEAEAEKKYLLYKAELKDGKLHVSPVTEYIREKFNTPQELKQFVAANMHNSYFFEETGTLKRAE